MFCYGATDLMLTFHFRPCILFAARPGSVGRWCTRVQTSSAFASFREKWFAQRLWTQCGRAHWSMFYCITSGKRILSGVQYVFGNFELFWIRCILNDFQHHKSNIGRRRTLRGDRQSRHGAPWKCWKPLYLKESVTSLIRTKEHGLKK